jgi:integrase
VFASAFSQTWVPVRTLVGLPPRWGFHGLRHYYATLLIHAGASVKTVQLALGHSTPTITLNAYVHEWPDVLDRARALVDGALGKSETAATPAGSQA